MRMKLPVILSVLIVVILPAANLQAANGVFEINQTCAEGDGCFPGDDAGFPVRIVNNGSYVLTSNLVVPPLVDGISTLASGDLGNSPVYIASLYFSIDLNGFEISSTTSCSTSPSFSCSPTGTTSGFGILFTTTSEGTGIITNGTVRGMAHAGVYCGETCTVRELAVTQNALNGLRLNGSARDIVATLNGLNGIVVIDHGSVTGSTARENEEAGFSGHGSFVNNAANSNLAYGIFADSGSIVIGNQVENSPTGVWCEECLLRDNRIEGNTNGVDFFGFTGFFGGNYIVGSSLANALINDGNAVQEAGSNYCNGSLCP